MGLILSNVPYRMFSQNNLTSILPTCQTQTTTAKGEQTIIRIFNGDATWLEEIPS